KEYRGGIRHLAQALVTHREHAELVDRAEAVLERAQHPEARTHLALEIQHRVDHVLQHARARDATLLGYVADEEYRGAGLLGETCQARRRFAHLRYRTRRGRQGLRPDGLDGIDHQYARL